MTAFDTIKICGIKTTNDVDICVRAASTSVGLNFHPSSPRHLSLGPAQALRRHAQAHLQVVGVFVRPDTAFLKQAVSEVGLDVVQLHGVDVEYLESFHPPPVPIWLAHGVATLEDIKELKVLVNVCRAMNLSISALLVDAKAPGGVGGTGQSPPWHLLRETTWDLPLILAGGLNPRNVGEAIRQVGPHGVDVASGVESEPGVKDPALIHEFVREARKAFEALGTNHESGK